VFALKGGFKNIVFQTALIYTENCDKP